MSDWKPTGLIRLKRVSTTDDDTLKSGGGIVQIGTANDSNGRSVPVVRDNSNVKLQQQFSRVVVTETYEEGEVTNSGFTTTVHRSGEPKKSHTETEWCDVEVVE